MIRPCYIYVIAQDRIKTEGGIRGPVKIGLTNNPNSRLATVNTGSPNPLLFACVLRVNDRELAQLIERTAHGHFAEHRENGEWFSVPPMEAAEFLCDFLDEFLLSGVAKRLIEWEDYHRYAAISGLVAIRERLAGERYMRAWEALAA
jgi:hypothetical protein